MKEFFGKYRGTVTGNKDLMYLGRIQVSVPAVLGDGRQSWAMPCVPYAGADVGFFAIPPVGANVWVEFEGGDPDYPIWTGCFWAKGELPANAKVLDPEKVQVFKTDGITFTLSNFGTTKGLTIEVAKPVVSNPLTLVFDDNGIEINNNSKTIAKLTAETIELSNDASTVTLAVDNIQIKEDAVEIKLTKDSIDLKNSSSTGKLAKDSIQLSKSPAVIKLSSSGVEINNSPAAAKLSSSGIELSNSPATVKLAPSGIELSNGAANVKLSPASVNINNGALEVI